VFAMLSAGGAPGVTTAALALTLSWPTQIVIAECDPSGGDILAGLLGGHLPATAGLLPLALEAGAGAEVPADILWRQLVELDEERNRLLLAGISDPRQSAALQSSLPWIAEALQGLRADVLADCGRLDALAAVRPVLSAASLAILVLQPTLRQVSRAIPRVEMLTNLMGPGRVVLLTVGDGVTSSRELAKTLGVPVAGHLPADPKTAGVLSDGLGSRRRLSERPLIRAAAAVGRGIRAAAESAGALPGFGGQPVYAPYATGPPATDGYVPGPPRLTGYPAAPKSPDRYAPGEPEPDSYPPPPPPMRLDSYAPGEPRLDSYAPGEPRLDSYAAGELESDRYPPPPPRLDSYAAGELESDRYPPPPPPPRLDPYDPGQYPARPPEPGYRDAGRSGWDPADAGWPTLMPYDPGPSAGLGPATEQFGADQYRVFGADQYRPGPDEPGEPDGTQYGPAQNGSRP
jgi:hypothetical protein